MHNWRRSQPSPAASYETQSYGLQPFIANRQERVLPESLSLDHAEAPVIRAQLQAKLGVGHGGQDLIAALRVGQELLPSVEQQLASSAKSLSLPSLGSTLAYRLPPRFGSGRHAIQFSASPDLLPSHARTADGSINTLYKVRQRNVHPFCSLFWQAGPGFRAFMHWN